MVIGMGKEGKVGLLGSVEIQHATEVEIDECVAVEDEELFLKMTKCVYQGTGRAARHGLLEVSNVDTKAGAIAEVCSHKIGAVVDKEEDVIDTLIAEEFNRALQQGDTLHRRHRLWDIYPQCLGEARTFAAGQNDCLHQGFSATISDTASLTAWSELI